MKFLADAMLGKLGRWLRLFGYDTHIVPEVLSDDEVLELARKEKRFLLTRDKDLFRKSKGIVQSHYFRTKGARNELREITRKLKLEMQFPDKTRCSLCNGKLKKNKEFQICSGCNQLYWQGSHWTKIKQMAKEIKT